MALTVIISWHSVTCGRLSFLRLTWIAVVIALRNHSREENVRDAKLKHSKFSACRVVSMFFYSKDRRRKPLCNGFLWSRAILRGSESVDLDASATNPNACLSRCSCIEWTGNRLPVKRKKKRTHDLMRLIRRIKTILIGRSTKLSNFY